MQRTLFGRKMHRWRDSGPQECSSLTLAGHSVSSRGDAVSWTPAPDLHGKIFTDLGVLLSVGNLGCKVRRVGSWKDMRILGISPESSVGVASPGTGSLLLFVSSVTTSKVFESNQQAFPDTASGFIC